MWTRFGVFEYLIWCSETVSSLASYGGSDDLTAIEVELMKDHAVREVSNIELCTMTDRFLNRSMLRYDIFLSSVILILYP